LRGREKEGGERDIERAFTHEREGTCLQRTCTHRGHIQKEKENVQRLEHVMIQYYLQKFGQSRKW